MNIREHIRVVSDFPKAGISFYDISTLLAHPEAWRETIMQMKEIVAAYQPDMLMGIESRGFLVAAPLALELGCGFGVVRKAGKLPGETLSHSYDLEYGSDTIEIQKDIVTADDNIVLVDDLLATGGTLSAAETLIKQAGANVAASVAIIELDGLGGREKLDAPFEALLNCPA